MTDGNRANKTGKVLENVVESIHATHGYEILPYADYQKRPEDYAGRRVLLKHVPYTSIYGHDAVSEFVSVDPGKGRIRIECKWQQASGSVDEKFPYTYLNAVEAMPEEHVIILVDGGGAKPRAIEWLKEAARRRFYNNKPGKRIDVMSMTEFTAWANRNL